ncbi:MAG: hypothetical protein P8Z70_06475 [Desulfuromonadales bacterium]
MPSPRYPIPAQRFRCEIEVERSRFVATVQEVATPEAAQAFVAELKAEPTWWVRPAAATVSA